MRAVLESLKTYWHPKFERCGFVTKSNEIVEVENKHVDPSNHFAIEDVPADVVALWHTHPSGCCNLSIDDYHLFRRLPHLIHIIIGHDIAYYYVDLDGSVTRGEDDAS